MEWCHPYGWLCPARTARDTRRRMALWFDRLCPNIVVRDSEYHQISRTRSDEAKANSLSLRLVAVRVDVGTHYCFDSCEFRQTSQYGAFHCLWTIVAVCLEPVPSCIRHLPSRCQLLNPTAIVVAVDSCAPLAASARLLDARLGCLYRICCGTEPSRSQQSCASNRRLAILCGEQRPYTI